MRLGVRSFLLRSQWFLEFFSQKEKKLKSFCKCHLGLINAWLFFQYASDSTHAAHWRGSAHSILCREYQSARPRWRPRLRRLAPPVPAPLVKRHSAEQSRPRAGDATFAARRVGLHADGNSGKTGNNITSVSIKINKKWRVLWSDGNRTDNIPMINYFSCRASFIWYTIYDQSSFSDGFRKICLLLLYQFHFVKISELSVTLDFCTFPTFWAFQKSFF